MGSIAPKLTRVDLETSGRHTMNGTGQDTGLPAVTADAKEMDPDAHKVNRDLAKQIQDLVAKLKPSDDGVPRFVLAWRMYPNADSKYWDTHLPSRYRRSCQHSSEGAVITPRL
jgi:hypothetical protein